MTDSVTAGPIDTGSLSGESGAERRTGLGRDVGVSVGLAVVATGMSYLIARAWGAAVTLDPLEILAVATSYSCTYLAVRQRRINYPVGVISTAAYAVLFHRQGLLASTALNLYLIPALVYGWIRWRPDRDTRPVTNLAPRWVPVYAAVTLACYLGAVTLVGWLDGELPRWDALILIGSMLAQFLLDNKKLQTWAVWAVVNVAAIYVYGTAGLTLAAAQYVFFLLNTVYGHWSWRRTMQIPTRAEAVT